MRTLYAASVCAKRNNTLANTASSVVADNENQATDGVLSHARNVILPVKDGWYDHKVSLVAIQPQQIEDVVMSEARRRGIV